MGKNTEVKSLLQIGADGLRELRKTIEAFEKIETDLKRDVSVLEAQLLVARANLRDTQILLRAQREKLCNDADDMHNMIERSISKDRVNGQDKPY